MAASSFEYRSMIYFAVATFHLYRKDLVESPSPDEFWEQNKKIIDRVVEEARNLFGYELSVHQLQSGCICGSRPVGG